MLLAQVEVTQVEATGRPFAEPFVEPRAGPAEGAEEEAQLGNVP